MGLLKRECVIVLVVGSLMISLLPHQAEAQVVGIEYGVAGVENFDPAANIGLMVRYPFSDRFTGQLSYTRWFGEDNNAEFVKQYDTLDEPSNAFYMGNNALNLTILYRVMQRKVHGLWLGGGLGSYQEYQMNSLGNKQSY